MDLSFQETSSSGTLTITAFAGANYCPPLLGVILRAVVKCTLPPNPNCRTV